MGRRRNDDDGGAFELLIDVGFRAPWVGLAFGVVLILLASAIQWIMPRFVQPGLAGLTVILAFIVWALAAVAIGAGVLGLVFQVIRRWFDPATKTGIPPRSDYPGPTIILAPAPFCPRCGVLMVRKQASRGPNAGHPFWGCQRFPACRQIIDIR